MPWHSRPHHGHHRYRPTDGDEGIGIMRLTANFLRAQIDHSLKIDDNQMISMLYFLAQKEGLLVGTSAALNVYGAYQIAKNNKNKHLHIVTMLCDSALRYQSKVFNKKWLEEKNLQAIIESIT